MFLAAERLDKQVLEFALGLYYQVGTVSQRSRLLLYTKAVRSRNPTLDVTLDESA